MKKFALEIIVGIAFGFGVVLIAGSCGDQKKPESKKEATCNDCACDECECDLNGKCECKECHCEEHKKKVKDDSHDQGGCTGGHCDR